MIQNSLKYLKTHIEIQKRKLFFLNIFFFYLTCDLSIIQIQKLYTYINHITVFLFTIHSSSSKSLFLFWALLISLSFVDCNLQNWSIIFDCLSVEKHFLEVSSTFADFIHPELSCLVSRMGIGGGKSLLFVSILISENGFFPFSSSISSNTFSTVHPSSVS